MVLIAGEIRMKAMEHFLFRSFWLIVFVADGHEYPMND